MATRNFKLTLDAKRHVVRALALGERHDDIVEQVREQFGISIHRRALRHYNPKYSPTLDESLKTLFEETHAKRWRDARDETARWFEERRQQHEREREEDLEKMRRKFGLR